jgi:hypothetical protein
MISVYHASTRSKSESPVLNGAPSAESFAGKRARIWAYRSGVRVLLSMTRWPMNCRNASSCAVPTSPRERTEPLKPVPSLT